MHRRHLSESQRGMVAAKLANMPEGRPGETRPIGLVSQPEAATMLNVGLNTVKRAKSVMEHGTTELIQSVGYPRLSATNRSYHLVAIQ
jgi:hypothetical protein